MKRYSLILAFLVFPFILTSEDVHTIDYKGEEYNIIIPEEDIEEAYIRAMTAYIEEMVDFEEMQKAFDEYKESAEKTIEAKDKVIEEQEALIAIKDKRIKELESDKEIFSVIPMVYYGRELEENNFGVGAGILLFNSVYIEGQVGYPFEVRFGVGFKF